MKLVAKSDNTTGNSAYSSYVLNSGDLTFAFSAPYGLSPEGPQGEEEEREKAGLPNPGFDGEDAHAFFRKHGLAVKAVGVLVSDAEEAYNQAVANGAVGKLKPTLRKPTSADEPEGEMMLSEILLYGDVHLRFVSGSYKGAFLPGYQPVEGKDISYG